MTLLPPIILLCFTYIGNSGENFFLVELRRMGMGDTNIQKKYKKPNSARNPNLGHIKIGKKKLCVVIFF